MTSTMYIYICQGVSLIKITFYGYGIFQTKLWIHGNVLTLYVAGMQAACLTAQWWAYSESMFRNTLHNTEDTTFILLA